MRRQRSDILLAKASRGIAGLGAVDHERRVRLCAPEVAGRVERMHDRDDEAATMQSNSPSAKGSAAASPST